MLVVHFMGLSNGSEIYIISSFEPIKSAMNKNVVNKEITEPVKCYPQTHKEFPIVSIHHPKHGE